MKAVILFFILLSFDIVVSGQKYEKFCSPETNHYGLREKSTGRIMIPPIYKILYNYKDTIIEVTDIRGAEGNLSVTGDTLVVFKKEPTSLGVFMCGDDSLLQGSSLYYPLSLNGHPNISFKLVVDKNRTCISEDFFPCPPDYPTQKLDTNKEYLRLINTSMDFCTRGLYDAAFKLINKAISLKPDNPFPYYWMGKLFVDCAEYGLTAKNNKVVSGYYNSIEQALLKADHLEKITTRSLSIKKVEKKFYKHDIINRKKVRALRKEIRILRHRKRINCIQNCKTCNTEK